jgi:hypothetical protein
LARFLRVLGGELLTRTPPLAQGCSVAQLSTDPDFSLTMLAFVSEGKPAPRAPSAGLSAPAPPERVAADAGFSAGSILAAVRLTLPPHRVSAVSTRGFLPACPPASVPHRALTPRALSAAQLKEGSDRVTSTEFINNLAKMPCTYRDEIESLQAFTDEITGETKRREAVEAAAAAKAADQGKKKKK